MINVGHVQGLAVAVPDARNYAPAVMFKLQGRSPPAQRAGQTRTIAVAATPDGLVEFPHVAAVVVSTARSATPRPAKRAGPRRRGR